MRPKAVFFDFGGTLAEQVADSLDLWVELAGTLRLNADRDAFARALDATDGWFHTAVFDYLGRTADLWPEYDRRILQQLGVEDTDGSRVAAIQERFRRVRWHRPFPETRTVLEALRGRGYALGVISNATDEIPERLQAIGLAEYFDTVTCSQEAGADKPDARVFRLALKRAGCEPGNAVHIGNSYEEDVIGALGVGMSAVLVDRGGDQSDAGCPRVKDLRGVLDLLE